jgi:uncharacterized membrane protein
MQVKKSRVIISVYLQAAVYLAAGLNHFSNPEIYTQIMPKYLPFHTELLALSGIAEVLLALGLVFSRTRKLSAWGLIALLVAIFPANIQMAQDFYREQSPYLWVAIARLPLQLLLIWWAYDVVKIARVRK